MTRKIYRNIGLPEIIQYPVFGNPVIQSKRAVFKTKNNYTVIISCVQDYILDPKREKSSEYKYEVPIPALLNKSDADLIICFGTAGYPEMVEVNGSVMMGHFFFIHSGKDDNPESQLKLPEENKLFGTVSDTIKAIYDAAAPENQGLPISAYLQRVPENSAKRPKVIAKNSNVAISVINITNYDDFVWADKKALDKFNSLNKEKRGASIETTHGLIAVRTKMLNIPCMWVTAVTDREGLFDFEVTPMQNYMCSYNAGIALAKAIDYL
jgi:hypothetical protein